MINKELSKKGNSFTKYLYFFNNIFKSQKHLEIISFLFWNLCYVIGVYNKQKIRFIKNPYLLFFNSIEDVKELKTQNYEINFSKINWTFMYVDVFGNIIGTTAENSSTIFKLDINGIIKDLYMFEGKIKGVFIDSLNNIYVCANGIIYKSVDENIFKKVLKLSTKKSYFLRDGITQTPEGDIFIGEYANILNEDGRWKFVGYIYHSKDNGKNWEVYDFLKHEGVNKHIHIISWSKHLNGLILSEGDNYKRIWYNQSKEYNKSKCNSLSGWEKVNKYHIQKGGHTSIVETKNKIVFGSDYMGGTNFVIYTNDMKKFTQEVVPNPYRKALFRRMELITNKQGEEEIWANLNFEWNNKIKNLILSKIENNNWKKIIEYNGNILIGRLVSKTVNNTNKIFINFTDRKSLKSKTIEIKSLL